VTTQAGFNLTEYISKRWYTQQQMTVEYLPADSNNCVTANYELKSESNFWGWTITVQNRAKNDDGTLRGGDICAIQSDSTDPAKLTVAPCFLPTFFGGPYWVLAHNEAEGWAVVSGGQPSLETPDGCQTGTGTNNAGLWIFTREINPPSALVDKARAFIAGQGFDLSVLNPVSHSDCDDAEGYPAASLISQGTEIGSELATKIDSGACKAVTTQAGFNLTEYISKRWYTQQQMTVEYLPADSNNCVTANYELKSESNFWGWTITVQNRAKNDDGTLRGGDICAIQSDSTDPAKLTVAPCFLPTFFGGPYWVLAHNEAEGWAVVSGGQPSLETPDGCQTGTGTNNAGLWIFTREINPPSTLVDKARGFIAEQGFDLSVLNPVSHSDCDGAEGY